jgi:hypothetical protein
MTDTATLGAMTASLVSMHRRELYLEETVHDVLAGVRRRYGAGLPGREQRRRPEQAPAPQGLEVGAEIGEADGARALAAVHALRRDRHDRHVDEERDEDRRYRLDRAVPHGLPDGVGRFAHLSPLALHGRRVQVQVVGHDDRSQYPREAEYVRLGRFDETDRPPPEHFGVVRTDVRHFDPQRDAHDRDEEEDCDFEHSHAVGQRCEEHHRGQ